MPKFFVKSEQIKENKIYITRTRCESYKKCSKMSILKYVIVKQAKIIYVK